MNTPRTDAAWAKTFEDDDDQCREGYAAIDMRDACATLERELAALTAERDRWQEIAQTASAEREHNANVASAAIAERDQLRSDCYYNHECINRLASSTGTLGEKSEKVVEVALSTIDQLRAEVERLKFYIATTIQPDEYAKVIKDLRAEVEKFKFLHQCESDSSVEAYARAERAEAIVGKLQELHGCSQEMVVHWCEHAANRSLGLDQARSELAAERARLDWLGDNVEEIYRERDQRGSCVYLSGENIRDAIDAATKGGAK